MLGRFSLGSFGLIVGGILSAMGFFAYATGNATLNLVGFFYGIPILLGGLALKAAELKPVSITRPATAEVVALRQQQATATQKQILKDVTRYRYGQKAHLDSSLSHLGLSPTDEERPILVGLQEIEKSGAYSLVLEFESPLIPLEAWQKKQEKMQTFFGPGVEVAISQPQPKSVNLALISQPEALAGE